MHIFQNEYAGRDLLLLLFLELGVVKWSYFLDVKDSVSKYLQFARLRVSFDLIKRMVATPLFHSFAVSLCD